MKTSALIKLLIDHMENYGDLETYLGYSASCDYENIEGQTSIDSVKIGIEHDYKNNINYPVITLNRQDDFWNVKKELLKLGIEYKQLEEMVEE